MTITAMRGLRYGLEEEFHLDLDQFVSATDVITVKRKLIRSRPCRCRGEGRDSCQQWVVLAFFGSWANSKLSI